MWTEYYNESQNLLNRNARGLMKAVILLFYAFIFSPLWFAGFMIQRAALPHLKGLEQVLTIAFTSLLLYWFFFLLKGIILFCKGKRNLIWIPLFLICTGFTSLAPAILLFQFLHGSRHPIISSLFCLMLFCLIYLHYQFHADGAPRLGKSAYHLGIVVASKII